MAQGKLPVIQGEQYWRLLRTDRDGASRDEILKMVGPFMAFALSEAIAKASGGLTAGPEQKVIKTGNLQWRIEQARPIEALDAGHDLLGLPEGTALGDRKQADPSIIPTVRATKAWYIIVRFWWRGSTTEVSWPRQQVSSLGIAIPGPLGASSDWLLDRAITPAQPDQDPGDATWGEAVEENITTTVKEVAQTVGSWATTGLAVVAGLGLLYLLILRQQAKSL